MGKAVGARLEFGMGHRLAGLRHDEGGLIGPDARVLTRIHNRTLSSTNWVDHEFAKVCFALRQPAVRPPHASARMDLVESRASGLLHCLGFARPTPRTDGADPRPDSLPVTYSSMYLE